MGEENGVRTRSFRYEEYYNRRVFLRSYPLQWEREEENSDVEFQEEEDNDKGVLKGWKRRVKERFMAVFIEGMDKGMLKGWKRGVKERFMAVFIEDVDKGRLKGWKREVKERFMAVFRELGSDECKFSLLLSKLRDKVGFYLVACNAFRYHHPRLQFLKATY